MENRKVEVLIKDVTGNNYALMCDLERVGVKSGDTVIADNQIGSFSVHFKHNGIECDAFIGETCMLIEVIGKSFIHSICGNIVIIVVTGIELEGERYDSDSYIGKKTIIFPNGNSFNEEWASDKRIFDNKLATKYYTEIRNNRG